MTGNVPYFGGRFTPAQAYAAAHPAAQPPSFPDPQTARAAPPVRRRSGAVSHEPRRERSSAETEAALQDLRASGVLSQEEYERLRARLVAW